MRWKQIPLFSYSVSDSGLIRNDRKGNILKPMWTGRKCKQYGTVMLCNNGDVRVAKVHVLVLEAFVGPRPHGHLALHRDDDTTNNGLNNLYWGTPQDNELDRRARGFKLTKAVADEIRARRRAGERNRWLAKEYGIAESTLCQIIKGQLWRDDTRGNK